ncbi:GntR family transcriptional regulator [Halobacillus sp. BAB-2008]|uniref:GntR family transcriptional regulator n=1 Tax=Halobacillus sp. BAB-2008 TaxID=1246484 RepID=UPI0002A515FF|nr:GntR family transcriptional regulator [Halobacillus sp. BAB-2008]ELK44456.1 GntR family transcriptional regulator [Halobacillus sp. BAB-2008]
MLDKKSPLPMYYQIEEDIKGKIESGLFGVGKTIPSERELSEQYGVSRMTVRQAVSNLVNEGALYREKGKGTFVSERKIEQPLTGMTSFTEDMKKRGMTATSRLIGFSVISAPPDIARKLHLEQGEEVYEIQRIRFADGKPMAVEQTFLPIALVPGVDESIVMGSLYEHIEENHDYKIDKATQVIEATTADQEQSELLAIPYGAAVLHIERLSVLTNGTPFEVVKSSYRADRYKFISEIHRT